MQRLILFLVSLLLAGQAFGQERPSRPGGGSSSSSGNWTNVITIQTNATTAEIQAAFDTGGTIWFTPSVYPYALTTNIYITNSVVVFGNNNVFTPSSLTVSNFLFDTRTNVPTGSVSFRDCKFDGGVHNAYSATSNYFSLLNGTPTLYYNPYWSNRSGMRISSQPGGLIQNCRFYRWPGNGLMLVNQGSTGAFTNGRVAVSECRFYSNFCGVYLPGSAYETAGYYNNPAAWQQAVPEYQPILGCEFYQNYMGLGGGAANGHIQQCMFTANIIGAHLTASINNGAHGIYDGNTYNHNDYGFWAESCQLGGFRDNRFLGNLKAAFIGSSITECQIEQNWFGSGAMIITNSSTGFFSRNAYQGSWSNTFNCAITNAVTVCGNYSTTVPLNNDGISCTGSNATYSGTVNVQSLNVASINFTNVHFLSNTPPATPTYYGESFIWNSNGAALFDVKASISALTWASTNLISPVSQSSSSSSAWSPSWSAARSGTTAWYAPCGSASAGSDGTAIRLPVPVSGWATSLVAMVSAGSNPVAAGTNTGFDLFTNGTSAAFHFAFAGDGSTVLVDSGSVKTYLTKGSLLSIRATNDSAGYSLQFNGSLQIVPAAAP